MFAAVIARIAEPPADERLAAGLRRALDPSLERPRLRDDVEVATFTTRWGERQAVAHRVGSRTYLRFTGDEADLLPALDGSRTVGELVVAGLDASGDLDPTRVTNVVDTLHDNGFLVRPPLDVYAAVRKRLAPGRERAAALAWRWLRAQTIPLPGVDAFAGAVYRGGGRILFTAPANVLGLTVTIAGLVAFVAVARRESYALTGHVSTTTAASLLVLGVVVLFVHEMGHALAVRRAGRRIVNAGFQLYLGHPAFFIDSSDLLMTGRRTRAVNALAGPYAEGVAAGVVALAVWAWPGGALAPLLFRFAGITYLNILINLIPFIELDGYWLVSDLLDVPRLRARSFAVLRYELPDRLRLRRPSFTPAERGLAAFGVLGGAFTIAALLTAWTFWGPVVSRLVAAMWSAGWAGRAVLAGLSVLIAGPLGHAAGDGIRAAARRGGGLVSDLRFRAQTAWRVEGATGLSSLVGGLDDEDLSDLAGRIARRRVRRDEAVVRQDEAADAFYLVRRGTFAIVERDGDNERLVRRAGPGEGFGELALLEGRPRTATVRAESEGELYAVDAGTFQRLLAPAMPARDLAPADWPVHEVWRLKPFRHLDRHSAAFLAERGEWTSVGGDEMVIAQGDAPDGFYVLASGRAEVLVDGRRTAVLEAGDYFGELALLNRSLRTAGVRTLTPARTFRIDGDVFRTLLAASFDRGTAAGERASGAH